MTKAQAPNPRVPQERLSSKGFFGPKILLRRPVASQSFAIESPERPYRNTAQQCTHVPSKVHAAKMVSCTNIQKQVEKSERRMLHDEVRKA
jgi:hypothetical protein